MKNNSINTKINNNQTEALSPHSNSVKERIKSKFNSIKMGISSNLEQIKNIFTPPQGLARETKFSVSPQLGGRFKINKKKTNENRLEEIKPSASKNSSSIPPHIQSRIQNAKSEKASEAESMDQISEHLLQRFSHKKN